MMSRRDLGRVSCRRHARDRIASTCVQGARGYRSGDANENPEGFPRSSGSDLALDHERGVQPSRIPPLHEAWAQLAGVETGQVSRSRITEGPTLRVGRLHFPSKPDPGLADVGNVARRGRGRRPGA